MGRPLPMFPLGTVLFPGTVLPLHVFEPRYRALTGYCLEHDEGLGVVLIERGHEVGGGDQRFSVGTQGRIARSVALADGRWLLAVVGEQRIRVERWLAEEPFPQAEVTALRDDNPAPGRHLPATLPAALAAAAERARRAVALKVELGEWDPEQATIAVDDDPSVAVWHLAALGLLGPVDCQRLLETDGLDARLELLTSLFDEEIDVLALRAGGR